MMALTPFFRQFGLLEDPFESTNADAEARLQTYFVPPPYFPAVLGDSRDPKSHIVLAPRGGGKSAQRRMVENRSLEAGDFLCVTYDRFDQPAGFEASQASLAYHLNQVCRLILIGVLVTVEGDPELVNQLSRNQRELLKFQINRFLGSLSAADFRAAVASLKNFGDKAKEFMKKYSGPLRIVAAVLIDKLGLANIEVPSEVIEEAKRDESASYHLNALAEISRTIGFESTYVLVDKVDEISITGDGASTFNFMRSLLTDLPTLETEGLAFKFFLWDQVQTFFGASHTRPDRVPIYTLAWTVDELSEMLSLRLAAYSEGRLASFNQMLTPDVTVDAHRLIAYLATGSPRDMIRLAKRISDEQTRSSERGRGITTEGLWLGVRAFSEERSNELYGTYLNDLKKVGDATFTIKELANDVFRIQDNAARRKVQLWQNAGIVARIGELANKPNRPAALYGIQDPRLLIAIRPAGPPDAILDRAVAQCPNCRTMCISDRVRVRSVYIRVRTRGDDLADGPGRSPRSVGTARRRGLPRYAAPPSWHVTAPQAATTSPPLPGM